VGWSALKFPWVDRPLNEEGLAIVNSDDVPPSIEGMNMEVLPTFMESLIFAEKHGFDPKTDYRKKPSLQVST
jgi:hypothetical protein